MGGWRRGEQQDQVGPWDHENKFALDVALDGENSSSVSATRIQTSRLYTGIFPLFDLADSPSNFNNHLLYTHVQTALR